MTDFKDLAVWGKAQEIAYAVYTYTKTYPAEEKFGITSQMRRAAVSISSNIAEGCGQGTDPGFIKFLFIAFGSACELESLCHLSRDLGFLTDDQRKVVVNDLVEEKKMLNSFIKKVQSRLT